MVAHEDRPRRLTADPDWPRVRQIVLDRYGPVHGKAAVERLERERAGERRHRSPGTGRVAAVVDKRNGAVVYRGKVMIRRKLHVVSVGLRVGRKPSVVEQECWRLLREKIHQVEAGTAVDTSRDRLLSTQMDAWLREKKLELRPRAYDNYARMAAFIKDKIGHVMLSELQRDHVTGLLEEMSKPRRVVWKATGKTITRKGLAPASLNLLHAVLMVCLHHAADVERRPVDSPVMKVAAPPVPKKVKPFFTPDEAGRLFDSMRARGDRYEAMWVLKFYTGNRLGECLGLPLKHLHLDRRTVTIAEALPPRPGKDESSGETKTRAMVEKPLSDEAYHAILRRLAQRDQEQAAAGKDWREHGLVFCREDGSPETQARARSQFRIALRAAGFPWVPPKNFRHSFATNARAGGEDLDAIAEVTGHRGTGTLKENYVQPVTQTGRNVVNTLEGMVRAARAARRQEPDSSD